MTLNLKKILSFALVAVIIVFCFSSCSGNVRVFSFSSGMINSEAVNTSTANHSVSAAKLSLVTSSGLNKLYYDQSSCAPAVADVSGKQFWTALPVNSSTGSAVFSMVVCSANRKVTLNSQDNCISFSSYSVDFNDDGYDITYYLSDNKATAVKDFSSLRDGELYVILPVSFTLTDGNLKVTVNCADITVSDGWFIETIDVLPYFGAVASDKAEKEADLSFTVDGAYPETEVPEINSNENKDDNEVDEEESTEAQSNDNTENEQSNTNQTEQEASLNGDFLLVPDGCGAVMYTDIEDSTTNSLSFDVYGSTDFTQTNSADVGVFGIKKGNSAFAAVIDNGDTIAAVNAVRAPADKDGLNRVYPSFCITSHADNGSSYFYSKPYSGVISVCYRFMSGSEANYVSMASACREELIRNGVLSSKTITSEVIPLNLSLICSLNGKKSTVTTTFAEAEDLLTVLKAKDINNINLILQGAFSGGLNQNNANNIKLLRVLGSYGGFEELSDYALKQGFNIFAGANLFTANSISRTGSAKDIFGNTLSYTFINPLAPYIGEENYKQSFIAADKVEENAIALMTLAKNMNIAGLCINDAASNIYEDFSSGGMSISEFSDLLKTNIAAFSTNKLFMLNGCNFNTLRASYGITGAPLHTSIKETAGYCSVPVIPVILHSSLYYSGAPANSYSVMQLELLKTVEYGAVPYFEWVFSNKSHLYYGNTLNEAVSFVQRAAKDLSDLNTDRISSHTCIKSGVYCTGYDNGSLVYVNYNNYSAVIGEISVAPFDYLRIN